MPEHDRSRDQDPDNVIFWRLSALEEAMKYNSTRITDHDKELARHERVFVPREEITATAAVGRDVWTLRLLALGTLLNGLGIAALFLAHP